MSNISFDCIVVGGGHAGCEASSALARLGLHTLLISGNLDRLGYLSCNPAIGGLAKGHMTREIDALGGQMGLWADAAGIQFRTLNMSKGPAVRATRAQMDRPAYIAAVTKTLFSLPNLVIWQDNVIDIIEHGGSVCGVRTSAGLDFFSKNVLLTTGTFLEGRIHIGQVNMSAGRMGDAASHGISKCLREFGIEVGRLKTGTTPRLLRSSIDFSRLEEQFGDIPLPRFSFYGPGPNLPQVSCHIAWTNEKTHDVIRSGFDRSPLFTGIIEGVGARYCPSIEDKVARFPNRDRHHIFLEPEGLNSGEVYANGISTSLPLDIQKEMIASIVGLENAVMTRPGYAIEYDYANPSQLWSTLESKKIDGLWMAGQINGTSGYEEAAAQGLWAAMNIEAKIRGKESFCPGRDMSYISVLVDDLVTLGTEEPYRMFTSRAEHRLLLREDNADIRLTPLGRKVGLIDDECWRKFCLKREKVEKIEENLCNCKIPDFALKYKERDIVAGTAKNLAEFLRRPEVALDDLHRSLKNSDHVSNDLDELIILLDQCDPFAKTLVETNIKYAGYIERQKMLARRTSKMEGISLPRDLDYTKVAGLSNEIVEKLSLARPLNLGQAGRISGVTPAAIGCLEIHLHKLGLTRATTS